MREDFWWLYLPTFYSLKEFKVFPFIVKKKEKETKERNLMLMSTHFIILLKTHGIDNIKELLHVLISLMLCFICICILERSKEKWPGSGVQFHFMYDNIVHRNNSNSYHSPQGADNLLFFIGINDKCCVMLHLENNQVRHASVCYTRYKLAKSRRNNSLQFSFCENSCISCQPSVPSGLDYLSTS